MNVKKKSKEMSLWRDGKSRLHGAASREDSGTSALSSAVTDVLVGSVGHIVKCRRLCAVPALQEEQESGTSLAWGCPAEEQRPS